MQSSTKGIIMGPAGHTMHASDMCVNSLYDYATHIPTFTKLRQFPLIVTFN